jgi:hypothetical protein
MDKFLLKKILLSSISFFAYFLSMALGVSAIGIFLNTIGAKGVPIILTVASTLAIVYNLLSSYLSARISPARFFYGTVLLITALLALVFFGVGDGRWYAIALFLIANFLKAFFDVTVTNFSYSLVTPLQGKSVIPLTKGFAAFGEMTGSVFASYLWIRSGEHFWSTLILLALVGLAAVVWYTGGLFAKRKANGHGADPKAKESGFRRMLESVGFVFSDSRLFLHVALCMVLIAFLISFTEFKFLTTLNGAYSGGELNRVLGQSYALINGLYLILSLFVTRWVLFRAGVANSILSYPMINLGWFVVMLALGMNVWTVIGMTLLITVLYSSVVSVTLTQVLALAPERINQSVYLLIKGVVRYAAALLASLCLLVYSFNLGLEKYLNTALIGIILVVLFFVASRLRRIYVSNLKANLQSDDEDLKLKSIDLLAEKVNHGKAERNLRQLLVSELSSVKVRIRTMGSLGIIGNLDSVVDLIEVLKKGNVREKFSAIENINRIVKNRKRFRSIPVTKHTLLEVYEDILVSKDPTFIKLKVISSLGYFDIDEVIRFLEIHLMSDNLSIRLNAIETLGAFRDRGVVGYLRPLLDNPDQRIVRQVIRVLWKFEDLRMVLLPKMVEIFSGTSPESIENSLILINKLRIGWEKELVERHLANPDPYLRALANLTMVGLGESKYLSGFVAEVAGLDPYPEKLDYVLSQYRNFSDSQKDKVLDLILERDGRTVDRLRRIFANSIYGFDREVEALGAETEKAAPRLPLPEMAKT